MGVTWLEKADIAPRGPWGRARRFRGRDKIDVISMTRASRCAVTPDARIGAGTGGHIAHEDLSNQDYYCIELRQHLADLIMQRFPQVHTVVGDCQRNIPFETGYFNRVLATHVLEHLTNLPAALDEIQRALAPGGLLRVVLPCGPGLAYGFAREISSERIFRKR